MTPSHPQPGDRRFTDEQLVAFVLGEAEPAAAAAIALAAESDAAVSVRLAHVRRMRDGLQQLQTTDATFAVSSRQRTALIAILPDQRGDWLAHLTERATQVALLLVDSLRGPAIAGYRSLNTDGSRLLRYECLETVIDLRVESDLISRQLNVTGECAGETSLAALRFLHRGSGEEVARCTVSPDGFFEGAIPPGAYAIEVIAHDKTSAVIPRVELGESQSSPS